MLLTSCDARAKSGETIDETVTDLKRLTPKVEAHGISFCYRNHEFEFSALQGATLWGHIAE